MSVRARSSDNLIASTGLRLDPDCQTKHTMPRQTKPITTADDDKLDGFAQQVEQALEHFAEPEWLGANSVLAAPFLVGLATDSHAQGETPGERGGALQGILAQASAQLDVELADFIADLYFQRNRHFTNVARALKHSMSERTFYRRRNQAIKALADALYSLLLPPLRSEKPSLQRMAGRDALLQSVLAALTARKNVCLSGQSGIGKTVLGAHVAEWWPHAVFWFTVRVGLTDRLSSFLFAFAHYLRSRGATHTWRQLIADGGKVQSDHVLGLLRYDLEGFQAMPLLVCVDDIDALTPDRSDHSQLLHLLDELRRHVRLLLIGQRVVLETEIHYVLGGFDARELDEWLVQNQMDDLTQEERKELYSQTYGHPTRLTLLAALRVYGEDLSGIPSLAYASRSLEALTARIWRRLESAEQQVLTELAIFNAPMPRQHWRVQDGVIAQLIERRLVVTNNQDEIECDRHIRVLLYEQIAPELRRVLNARAAAALEAYGEFLRAMHHYIEAHQPAQAVWLWFSRRTQLIAHGQGPAALTMLDQIAVSDLPAAQDQAALNLARAELLQLVGRPDGVAQALGGLHLGRSGTTAAYAQQLLADALEKQGDIEHALASYRLALETLVGSIPLRQVALHQKISYLHLARLPDLAAAQRESLQALFHAETFAANVAEMKGELAAARARYTTALGIANQIGDDPGLLAIGYSHMGKLLLKTGELDDAVTMIEHALTLSAQRGDMVGPLYDRINLSYALTVQHRYDDALAIAVNGLAVAERMRHAYLIAGLAAAAGDAACRHQMLDDAEYYATRSLLQEEEFFRAWALTVLGTVQTARSQHSEAAKTLLAAAEIANAQEDPYGEAYALHALGSAYWRTGDQSAAVQAFGRAYHLYRVSDFALEADRLRSYLESLGLDTPSDATVGS